jgi:hypothetical protein
MHIPEPDGPYVGLGEGDHSPEVPKVKAKLKAKFKPARDTLDDSDLFTRALTAEVIRVQDIYRNEGLARHPGALQYLRGVVNREFKYDIGLLARPAANLPINFTLEGHLSNMFFGPCAQTASALEAEGAAHWKPVWYKNDDIPFKNNLGVEAMYAQLSSHWIEGPPVDPNQPDGPKIMWWFGPEVPWGLISFSQGAMIACEFMWKYVLPPNAPLHYRLNTFRRGLAFGNPRRAKDAVCSWAQSPPSPGTHGIMDRLFDAHKEGIGDRWAEHPNDEDMFAEVGDDEMSLNQTAIAQIICEGNFTGGPAAIWRRVLKVFGNPFGGLFNIVKSIYDAVMFLAANPNPHYSTFATSGDVDWMRGVAS